MEQRELPAEPRANRAMLSRLVADASEHSRWYFQTLQSEYNSIDRDSNDAPAEKIRSQIDSICARNPRNWYDLFTLEKLLLKLQPEHRLSVKLVALRESYRQMIGGQAFRKYLESCALRSLRRSGTSMPSKALLLAEAENVLSEIHWHYSVTLARQQHLEGLQWAILYRFLWIPMLGVVIAFVMHSWQVGVGTYLIVLLAGTTGSFASVQRRIQKSKYRPGYRDPITRLFELDHDRLSLYLSLASGSVFATVLYLLFIGGLLGGGVIFPLIDTPSQLTRGAAFREFCLLTEPHAGSDYAKLLVWCFLAGFAERFVPDVLDRLTKTAESDELGADAPTEEEDGSETIGQ